MERILKSLPDIKQSAGTIVAFYATTLYYSDQVKNTLDRSYNYKLNK